MRMPTFRTIRHWSGYLLGALLFGWGWACFGYELFCPDETIRGSVTANGILVIYGPSMFAGVIIALGTLLFFLPRFDWVSGPLISFGGLLSGFAMIFLAYCLGDQGKEAPRVGHLVVVAALGFLFLVGCGSVVGGIFWRLRPRRPSPEAVLEPPASSPQAE